PHLDDGVVPSEPGGADDAAYGVGVDDEVLAALLGRAYAEPVGQCSYVGGAEQAYVAIGPRHARTLRGAVHPATPRRTRRTDHKRRVFPSRAAQPTVSRTFQPRTCDFGAETCGSRWGAAHGGVTW